MQFPPLQQDPEVRRQERNIVISELMRTWDLTGTLPNPPLAHRIPSSWSIFGNIALTWPMPLRTRPAVNGRSSGGGYTTCYSEWPTTQARPVNYELWRNSQVSTGNAFGKTYTPAGFLTPQNPCDMPRYMTLYPPVSVWQPSGRLIPVLVPSVVSPIPSNTG